MKNNFLLSCHGRFHYFEIAKVLYNSGQLSQIITNYPWFKIKNEGIPKSLVSTNSFFQVANYLFSKANLKILNKLHNIINWNSAIHLDHKCLKFIDKSDIFLSLSGGGLQTGREFIKQNKIYICERSSFHLSETVNIMKSEYKKYKKDFLLDQRVIDRELEEYQTASFVLTPSEICKKTFIKNKIFNVEVIPYAANLQSFYPLPKDKNKQTFDILFIGQLSLRKGLPYLLDAFNKFKHPFKKLHLIGLKTEDFSLFAEKINRENTILYGAIPNDQLVKYINKADVFTIASIEDGYAIVVPQALACGIPVITTLNTGSSDVVSKFNCGFVVEAMNSDKISEKFYEIVDNKNLLKIFSENALKASSVTWESFVSSLNGVISKYRKEFI